MKETHQKIQKLTQIDSIRAKTVDYLAGFQSKSGGFRLPEISYLGSLVFSTSAHTPFLIAIPIKNQEEGIEGVLNSLLESITIKSTLGIIFDNCTDTSQEKVIQYFLQRKQDTSILSSVHFLSSQGELFEATCENLIFTLEDADFLMSLQSDIYLNDRAFQERAVEAFGCISELFALSGRAIVRFIPTKRTSLVSLFCSFPLRLWNKFSRIFTGKVFLSGFRFHTNYFGDISEYQVSKMKFSRNQLNTVYLGEATIRGPLIWRASFFKDLNGLNDVAHYLGRDDCDVSLRAWNSNGWRSGFMPSLSYSIPTAGTTRRPRTPETLEQLRLREELSQKNPGELMKSWREGRHSRKSGPKFIKVRISSG